VERIGSGLSGGEVVVGRPNPEDAREAWEREVDRLESSAGVELDRETRETVVRELIEEQPRGPRAAGRGRRLAVVRAAGEIKARERSLSGREPGPPSSGRAENHPHPGEPG
jgi:hypothetical protein